MTDIAMTTLPTISAQPENQPKPAQAFGLALLIEIGMIAVVVAIITSSPPIHAAHDEPVPLTLVEDDTPKKEEPKPEPKPKPEPVKQISKIVPKQVTPPRQAPVAVPTPPLAELQSDVQTAFADPTPAPVIPPPPVPTSGKVDPTQEYAAKVHDAVQSAYFYPAVAASMHFSGRVRVEFILKDAHVIESHVMQTCGIGLFDQAAIAAVKNARYPQPPEKLMGQDLHYQLWVELSTR